MFGIHSKALRAGLVAATVIGIAAIPTVAIASGAGVGPGAAIHLAAGKDEPRDARLDALAKALGITPEALKAAMEQVRQQANKGGPHNAHLDAVAKALGITPEALKAAIEQARQQAGKPDPAQRGDKAAQQAHQQKYLAALAANLGIDVPTLQKALEQGRPAPVARPAGQHFATVAKALGVTPEALKAAIEQARQQAGKPDPAQRGDKAAQQAHQQKYLAALAANLGIDVPTLQKALDQGRPDPAQLAQRKADARVALVTRLDALVASDKLTQDQANQMLANFDAGKPLGPPKGQSAPGQHGRDGNNGHRGGGPAPRQNAG